MSISNQKTIKVDLENSRYFIQIEKKTPLMDVYIADEDLEDVIILTDDHLAKCYENWLKGYKTIVVPRGEGSKSMSVYASVLEKMVDYGITRKGLVVAFGGGVIGDLAGVVAATYMRGIRLVHIPTTLLAMVDSSVGGKAALNLSNGKNLVGVFYQPEAVYINLEFLKTLPSREWSNGMAEIIKYAVGFDASLLELLEHPLEEILEVLIFKCVLIKAGIVMQDEKDEGVRNLLNFGHTIGHAIEHYYGYERFLHGEAVAIGIAAKIRIAYQEGLIKASEQSRVLKIIEKYGLPCALEEGSLDLILEGIKRDKKSALGKIKWIGLKSLGALEIRTNDFEDAIKLFSGGLCVTK